MWPFPASSGAAFDMLLAARSPTSAYPALLTRHLHPSCSCYAVAHILARPSRRHAIKPPSSSALDEKMQGPHLYHDEPRTGCRLSLPLSCPSIYSLSSNPSPPLPQLHKFFPHTATFIAPASDPRRLITLPRRPTPLSESTVKLRQTPWSIRRNTTSSWKRTWTS